MEHHPHPQAFSHRITIRAEDIDELGHVNNVIYLRWVQEVAAAHWKTAPQSLQEAYAWVVIRHEIDYHQPAFLDDELIGYTWVGPHNGARIERFVYLYKSGNAKPIATAKTIWCLLDAKSMRPRRITEEVAEVF